MLVTIHSTDFEVRVNVTASEVDDGQRRGVRPKQYTENRKKKNAGIEMVESHFVMKC